MDSLFNITTSFLQIVNELEENGGELTEELSEALQINKDNFSNKVENYCKLITSLNNDINACKTEKDRVNQIQKVKKNIVERLKNILLESIKIYGEDGKSGNKVVELPTRKLYTRITNNTVIDEYRIEILSEVTQSILAEFYNNGLIGNVDFEGLMSSINVNAKSIDSSIDDFTIEDLKNCKLRISKTYSLKELFEDENKTSLLSNEIGTSIENVVDIANIHDENVTIITNKTTESLIIK